MNPFYYKGFTVTISSHGQDHSVSIVDPETKEVTQLDVTPTNCSSVDPGKFAKEFIDGVLISAIIVEQ